MAKVVYAVEFYGHRAPLIFHWGFLVTDGKDYNFVYSNRSAIGGISKESWSDMLAQNYVPRYFFKTDLTEEQLIEKTKACCPNKPFDKLFFNCNTYVQKIWKEAPRMQNLYVWLGIGVLLASTLFVLKFEK